MNLLDALVETIIDGRGDEVVFVEVTDGLCRFPGPGLSLHTKYKMGCRCHRCREHHNEASLAWRRAHR